MAWARWFDTADRVVKQDLFGDDASITVSTVFLGIDHSFFEGPPVLWETMVFGGPLDDEQARYTSRTEALLGHARYCLLMQMELSLKA